MNLSQTLLDIDGKALPSSKTQEVVEKNEEGIEVVRHEEVKVDLTALIAIDQALMYGNEVYEPDEVEARYLLRKKIMSADEVKFTKLEKEMIRSLVCVRWNVYIAGQLIDML